MITANEPTSRTVAPSPSDLELAKRSHHRLGAVVEGDARIELSVHPKGGDKEVTAIPIPVAAYRLLLQILADMAEGNAVTVIPLHREMTTQEAADFLEMSRPSLIKLLDQGEIGFRKVGKHRRIRFLDVAGYKERSMADRHAALDELAQQAQELGMGY